MQQHEYSAPYEATKCCVYMHRETISCNRQSRQGPGLPAEKRKGEDRMSLLKHLEWRTEGAPLRARADGRGGRTGCRKAPGGPAGKEAEERAIAGDYAPPEEDDARIAQKDSGSRQAPIGGGGADKPGEIPAYDTGQGRGAQGAQMRIVIQPGVRDLPAKPAGAE